MPGRYTFYTYRNKMTNSSGVVDPHWLNVDPDPAFYLNANGDPDPESQTNADPCGSGSGSWSDFKVIKSWIFLWKNIIKVGNIGTEQLLKHRHKIKFKAFWSLPIQFCLFQSYRNRIWIYEVQSTQKTVLWIGSVSRLEPDSMGSLDPYSDPDSRSRPRRAKMTKKHRKKLLGHKTGKFQFLIKKKIKKFRCSFWSSNPWIRTGSGFTWNAGSGSGLNESGSTALQKNYLLNLLTHLGLEGLVLPGLYLAGVPELLPDEDLLLL